MSDNETPEIPEELRDAVIQRDESTESGDPFAIDHAQAQELAAGEPDAEPEPQQLDIPMLDIPLTGANLTIQKGPNGERIIVAGPIMFRFVLPLPAEVARMVARDLTGGIEVASAIPPMVRGGRPGR